MMPGRTPFKAELIVDGINLARVKTDGKGNVLVSLGHGAYQETVIQRQQIRALAVMLIEAAAATAPRPPWAITICLQCQTCGHEQTATSASMVMEADGIANYLFGSSRHYCDKCDGPLKEISHAPGT